MTHRKPTGGDTLSSGKSEVGRAMDAILPQPRAQPRTTADGNPLPDERQKRLKAVFDAFWKQNPRQMKSFIEDIERNMIVHTLASVFGNQRAAARILGLKTTTLNAKIKRYGIVFEKEYRNPGDDSSAEGGGPPRPARRMAMPGPIGQSRVQD